MRRWTCLFAVCLVVLGASGAVSCGGAIGEDLGLAGGGASGGDSSSGGTSSGGQPTSSGGDASGGVAAGSGGAMAGSAATGGTGDGGTGGTVHREDAFVTLWNTQLGYDGESARIQLPLVLGGTYDFSVDWGDGTTSEVMPSQDSPVDHDYAEPGVYEVVIQGVLEGWSFDDTIECGAVPDVHDCPLQNSAQKLVLVEQWGSFRFGTVGGAFARCHNLVVSATDTPDLSPPTNLARAFFSCFELEELPASDGWDTSSVVDMSEMFAEALYFEGDISDWDTSSVTNMESMFAYAMSFNGDVSDWDTSSVTNMATMFSYALSFNGDVSSWDISSVTDMTAMFADAAAFNQDLSAWDTSSVTDMGVLFRGAETFNQDLSAWDTSKVLYMELMFDGAVAFNQDISAWDTSSVLYMSSMFQGATAFNQDISAWDTSSVRSMGGMFYGATAFDQDLGAWSVASLDYAADMFLESGLSTESYDNLLIGWAAQPLAPAVGYMALGAGTIQYSAAAVSARAILTDDLGWIISDGGLAP